jgi:hypothetical protein
MAAEHVLHMQKALDQMNLQIHRVLSDITGMSGLRILDAILAGKRDPVTLARLCHGSVKSSEDTIAKSLEGDYRQSTCSHSDSHWLRSTTTNSWSSKWIRRFNVNSAVWRQR